MTPKHFAILGAGSGGQCMAAHLTSLGFDVSLYDINKELIHQLQQRGSITLTGALEMTQSPKCITDDLSVALQDADMIMVVATADAHVEIAKAIAPYAANFQRIILHPGAVFGAQVFKNAFQQMGIKNCPVIAEAQDLIYTCRTKEPGEITVNAVKKALKLASIPASAAPTVVEELKAIYPQLIPAESILEIGMNYMAAICHPIPMLLNAAKIDRKEPFRYYREGITESVSRLMEKADSERVKIAKALGMDPISMLQSQQMKYGVEANSLMEAYQKNPAFEKMNAPMRLDHRFIFEDVPAGSVPYAALGDLLGIDTPVFDAVIDMAGSILGIDYWTSGRNLENLGLSGLDVNGVVQALKGE